jgi:hypothetical protein
MLFYSYFKTLVGKEVMGRRWWGSWVGAARAARANLRPCGTAHMLGPRARGSALLHAAAWPARLRPRLLTPPVVVVRCR